MRMRLPGVLQRSARQSHALTFVKEQWRSRIRMRHSLLTEGAESMSEFAGLSLSERDYLYNATVGSQQEICALTAVEVTPASNSGMTSVPPLKKIGSSTGLKVRNANLWLQYNPIAFQIAE
jgi:hypothetical protein